MNVCVFTSSYLPELGGIQFELYWLLKAMDNKLINWGIRKLLFLLPKYDNQKYLDFKNIEVLEYDAQFISKKDILSFIPRLIKLSTKYHLDLIHCHSALPEGVCCYLMKYLNRVPYIITSHGADIAIDRRLSFGARIKPLTSIIVRQVLMNAACVTTISQDMVNFAKEAGATKIRLIPDGIDLCDPVVTPESKAQEAIIREKYSLSPLHTVYITLSGMRKIKGHENLVKGFSQALKENPNLVLFIGAHGQETENIKSLVRELGIGERVHFIGFVTGAEKLAWFSIAHVYCNTAFFEPFGIVYIESIKHGMAVIGSLKGGAKDIFEHDKSGYLVNPESVEDIGMGILKLSDEEYRNRLIDNSRNVLWRYDINRIADKYLETYENYI